MSCNILIDRCGMIQKLAKLRPVGPARRLHALHLNAGSEIRRSTEKRRFLI